MKTISTTVYTFDELSDEAKEKARNWYREGSYDYEWWESVYEDAASIGLKITGFDIGRGSYCEGTLTLSSRRVAENIIKDHGGDCETHKTAVAFMDKLKTIALKYPDEGDEVAAEEIEAAEQDFSISLREDYRSMLQREWDYINSGEAVDDNIIVNEYTFTESGKRFG